MSILLLDGDFPPLVLENIDKFLMLDETRMGSGFLFGRSAENRNIAKAKFNEFKIVNLEKKKKIIIIKQTSLSPVRKESDNVILNW